MEYSTINLPVETYKGPGGVERDCKVISVERGVYRDNPADVLTIIFDNNRQLKVPATAVR